MRTLAGMTCAVAFLIIAQPATADVLVAAPGFTASALPDNQLAAFNTDNTASLSVIAGASDRIPVDWMRRTVDVGTTLTDLWSLDVVGPLIAANARGSGVN